MKQQRAVPVFYDGIQMETNLRFDLLVDDTVVIELKTVENMLPVYEAQILTYMKLLKVP